MQKLYNHQLIYMTKFIFNNHESKQPNHGFTLVELLIVIVLIGVVSGITISIINPITQIKKGRDSQRRSDLKLIQSVLEYYISDNGHYPLSLYATSTCGESFSTSEAKYLDKIPCDPTTSNKYTYQPQNKDGTNCAISTNCRKYTLTTCLELNYDPKDLPKDNFICPNPIPASYTVNGN